MSDGDITTPASDDAVAKPDKLAAVKTLLMWGSIATIIFAVVVFSIAFLFITIRGGTLPSTEVFTTVIKTLGDVIVAVVGK